MALTAKRIETAKARESLYRLTDGEGLSLEVPPKGKKRWRFRYKLAGKEKMLSLGTFPEVSLQEAREKKNELRKLVAKGVNPSDERKEQKAVAEGRYSFEALALEWFAHNPKRSEKDKQTVMGRLQRHILPVLGNMTYEEITAQHVRDMVQRIAGRGTVDIARRCCDLVSQIYKYGIVTGKTEKNPALYVKAVLPPQSQTLKHHAALTDPKEVGRLMRSIEEFQGTFVVRCALQIAAYTFLRSSEIRKAPWSEIDFENRLWRIPAERMKRNNPHLVPLSDQAISVLRELHPLTQNADFIFPSVRTDSKPLSENTLNVALRGIGFSKEQMTLHGLAMM